MAERDYVVLREGSEGNLVREWPLVALKDLIDLRLSSVDKKSKATENDVKLCNYMDVYKNSFIHSGMDFMAATATKREIAKCSVVKGDVLITKDSEKHDDIGVPALVREDVPNLVCGYHLAILRPHPEFVDGAYLFYALSNQETQHQFHSFANGITRFGLRKADIGLVEIPLPSLQEQRAIAHVLGTLDDKIELNRRMNETLEGMARALFKSWFVDFEPVRAKMEGRWRRGESLPGLPADLYDLFPERLAPSELGEIPEGWEVRQLGELCTFRAGSVFRKANQGKQTGKYPFIKVRDMSIAGNAVGILNSTNWVNDDDLLQLKAKFFPSETTVFAKIGEGLRQNRIRLLTRTTLLDNNMMGAIPDTRMIDPLLLYYCLSQFDFGELANGTALPYLTARTLNSLIVPLPCLEVQMRLSISLRTLVTKTIANDMESLAVAAQRDALLPGLVSGEVRVGEVKNEVD